MIKKKEFLGEFIGTYLLVLFGCGSVATSILFNTFQSLFQIAMVWGIGVTLAIYLTRHLSCAHLNPAVSIAMVLSKRMNLRKLPNYLLAQITGSILAGFSIYVLFGPAIVNYELSHNIVSGTEASIVTAKMFGEFYQVPGAALIGNMPLAIAVEAFGTFLLVLMIFALTEGCNLGRPDNALAPIFIGLTVTSIICLIAPLTQAGLNPARDFGPRLVAWMTGWGNAAFPDNSGGFFWVYILAPIAGGVLATGVFIYIVEPAMNKKSNSCNCN